MRGRRKVPQSRRSGNRKPNSGLSKSTGVLESQTASESHQSYEDMFPADTSTFECGSFASRSSVRLINEVVSKFDEVKRALVRSVGFHGILEFPLIKQFNRRFTLWLMSCVDEHLGTINIGEHIAMKFSKVDVGHVIGIPSSGKKILDARFSCRDAKDKVLNHYLPVDFKELRSIKLVQEVIERNYEYPMTKSECDMFKVSFVVFVASNLLSPSAKHDYACIDYWNGIQDPDGIALYDWAEYVMVRLLEAVAKLKQDIASNIRFPNISGCSIFLQILYLDSLDLEGNAMRHNTVPRIREFSFEKLRSMILADGNYARHYKGGEDIPLGRLRDPVDCIYSWAMENRYRNEESGSLRSLALWECAVAMVHLLNIPLEAAGPVFVAVCDFQDQINAGMPVTGMQAMKFVTVLASIMIPYTRGFSYQSSYGADYENSGVTSIEPSISNGIRLIASPIRSKRLKTLDSSAATPYIQKKRDDNTDKETCVISEASASLSQGSMNLGVAVIGDDVQSSIKSVMASLDNMPHSLKVDTRVSTAMSKFYGCLRLLNPIRSFDLNALSPETSYSSDASTVTNASDIEGLPSPWELGYSWSVSDASSTSLIEKLKYIQGVDRFVIIHSEPKHIQVSGRALRAQLLGKSEFELDFFDALIRLIRQEDDELYGSYGSLRWRHFFESDFMESVLSGSFDLIDCNMRNHLSMSSQTYDLSKTKLVFFPCLLQCRWVCFTWHLESNLLSVFEPSHGKFVPRCRVEAIERACYLLKLALRTLCRATFLGVRNDVSTADMRLLTLVDDILPRFNRTGILCSIFCRCYDGVQLTPNAILVDHEVVACELLSQVSSLKNNTGLMSAEDVDDG